MSEGACPACRRPVAAQRASCLYCGSPLAAGRDVAAQGAGPVEHSDPTRARTLLVLDLGGANAARLERALGLSAFEAAQWTRRGGYRLHRIVDREQAEAETARLVEAGLSVLALVEAEVREAAQTLVALGGAWRGAALEVRTPEDRLELRPEDVLLVVKGSIVRQRQASALDLRRLRSAAPESGFLLHLHRRSQRRPVELDPEVFALGPGAGGGAWPQLYAWAERLCGRARPIDDGFRHLPPALAPAAPRPLGGAAGAAALSSTTRRRPNEPTLLDNVSQFRFYSAWRATLERGR